MRFASFGFQVRLRHFFFESLFLLQFRLLLKLRQMCQQVNENRRNCSKSCSNWPTSSSELTRISVS